MTPRRLRNEAGQTLVEYVMILGLLTAIIISLTRFVVPFFGWVIASMAYRMSMYLTSL
jgi:Flp pilus assembly pilin Flp